MQIARALEYLDHGDLDNAVTSMLSDLSKHPDTEEVGSVMGMFGIHLLMSQRDSREVRRFIEGFR